MKKIVNFLLICVLITSLFALTQAQNTCADPIVISGLPYSLSDATTEGSGDNYDNTMACGSAFMNGEDFVFSFTPANDMFIKVTLSNTSTGIMGGPGVFVVKNCPDLPNAECVAFKTGSPGASLVIPNAHLTQGETYYIIVSSNPGFLGLYDFTSFTINIEEVFAIDAGIVEILSPISGCELSDDEIVAIKVKNFGFDTLSNLEVAFSIDGGVTEVNAVINGNILPGATHTFSFDNGPVDFSIHGLYSITAYTKLSGDANPTNDSLSQVIEHLLPYTSFPYFADFESGSAGWYAAGANSTWQLGTPSATTINSAASGTKAWVTNLSGNFTSEEVSFLNAPCYDFSSLVLPMVEMKVNYAIPGVVGLGGGYASLEYSTDGGLNWTRVNAGYASLNWYTGIGWYGNTNGWITVRTSVPELAEAPNVSLRIAFTGGSGFMGIGEGIGIDDFRVFETPPYDAGVVAITTPTGGCNLNDEVVSVRVANYGSVATDNLLSVAYKVNNGTPVVEQLSSSLNPGDTMLYSFATPLNMSAPGIYNITAYTILAGDSLIYENDTAKIIVHSFPTISNFPYSEDFESNNGNWLPAGTAYSWEHGIPIATIINQSASGQKCWATNLSGNHIAAEVSYLVSPCFDFTDLANPFFRMKLWFETPMLSYVSFEGSLNNGQTWFTVGTDATSPNWFNVVNGWTGNSGQWIQVGHPLDTFVGKPNVKLRISYNGLMNAAEGVAIDDIEILNCIPPLANFSASVNLLEVSFSNTSTNTTTYLWDFGDGNTATVANPTHTYAAAGSYTVCLTSSNDCTTHTKCETITTTVGISEAHKQNFLKVFPNPAIDEVIIHIQSEYSANYNQLKVFDAKGTIVMNYNIVKGQTEIRLNVSDLPSGIYAITIGSLSQRIIVE